MSGGIRCLGTAIIATDASLILRTTGTEANESQFSYLHVSLGRADDILQAMRQAKPSLAGCGAMHQTYRSLGSSEIGFSATSCNLKDRMGSREACAHLGHSEASG